jgi:hypothetical protein
MLNLILIIFTILPAGANADSKAVFRLPSGVNVHIVEDKFQKSLFKVEGCSDQDNFCRINGRVPFGVAFGLPFSYVKSIKVSFKRSVYLLDVSDMYNAWGTRPLEVKGVIRYFGGKCSDEKNCQFRGVFSDAGGAYVAEWRIVGGKSIRTVLTDSDDVNNLFIKNIDPPEYE